MFYLTHSLNSENSKLYQTLAVTLQKLLIQLNFIKLK